MSERVGLIFLEPSALEAKDLSPETVRIAILGGEDGNVASLILGHHGCLHPNPCFLCGAIAEGTASLIARHNK
jgi:hypothetical protein